jgi:GT2 family glycosyltransferase
VTRRPSVSLIVSSYNEGDQLWRTARNLASGLPDGAEIVVVDDGSTDGSVSELARWVPNARIIRPPRRLGVAAARNLGAARSAGEILLFADAHVRASGAWIDQILPLLADQQVGAVGPAIARMRHPEVRGYGLRYIDTATNLEWLQQLAAVPYPVPVLGGFFLAFRRELFETVRGFDAGMRIYGMEDPEICMRLWTFGYRCLLVPSVVVRHAFRAAEHQFGWKDGLHNILRFGVLHFGAERLERLLAHYHDDPALPAAMARLIDGDAWEWRAWIRATRIHDDGWYFDRLNPALSIQAGDDAEVTLG